MKNKYIVDDHYATKLYLFKYALKKEILSLSAAAAYPKVA